ncbi:MAG: penicillin acylase family protein [Bacteroidales bacterium]|nr:penicillin acylase family protein [Bacteroidales bacterium]
MKIVKIILKGLIDFFYHLFVALLAVRLYAKRALPDYNKNVSLKGLSANVEVYRDEFAIPHVYAETERDLYVATGYLWPRTVSGKWIYCAGLLLAGCRKYSEKNLFRVM